YWIIGTLGRYWTHRIITLAEAPIVARGPFRFVRHPNYAVTLAETLLVPLAFGQLALGIIFTAVWAAVLHYKIRLEDEALAAGRARFRLDEALLGAAARAGAEVVRGALATGIELGDGAAAVRTEGRVWPAGAVALATGKHPLRGFARPPSPMVGFKLHLEPTAAATRELAGIVQLVFFRGGYVGACLVED